MKKILLALVGVALLASGNAKAEERNYFQSMGIQAAWEVTKGREDTLVALLGTGVNYYLPEFAGRIEKDAQGNYGYDAFSGKPDPMDLFPYGLGTQVASIVAGNSLGVAPGVKFIPVRVFDENGISSSSILVKGIEYATSRGAKIIEIGGGPFRYSSALCDAFMRAQSAGALIVVPAGNGGAELKDYPENCPVRNMVVIASTDESGELAKFSNFGFPTVQLAAQGQGVWGIGRDGALNRNLQGSSFSSALATGVAALVWSAHPEYSAEEVKNALIRGATYRESLSGRVLSNGLLNALLAIQADPTRVN